MKILVTGAKGFVGRNLVCNLYNIKDGKNCTRDLKIEDIFEYDMDSSVEELETYCRDCLLYTSKKQHQVIQIFNVQQKK